MAPWDWPDRLPRKNKPCSTEQGHVICFFRDEGYFVWGAHASGDAAFRYPNVRRLFNMIEESIAESTRWIVFPNRMTIRYGRPFVGMTAFCWVFGATALMGRTPEEAFYVKVRREKPTLSRASSRKVTIEVGLAPVLPAEFIIFRISQDEAGTEIDMLSA